MSSEAQIAANRLNSQLSSGPKTEAGKAKSSHNAVKSALTGQTVLLPTDDVPAYQKLAQSLIDLHRPATYEEEILVQSLTDTQWRLRRIPGLEAAIYAVGRSESTDPMPEYLIDVQIYLKYERHLKNLNIQEARLRRMYEKDAAHLRTIQVERKEAQENATKQAPEKTAIALFTAVKRAAADNPSLDISGIGFDFANSPQAAKKAA